MRCCLLPVACVAALALSAASVLSAAAPTRSCGFVAFTPNSGDGVFDIRARSITCATARAKLRAARGVPKALSGWRCRLVRRDEVTGAGRYACTSRAKVHGVMRTRLIAFTTGN